MSSFETVLIGTDDSFDEVVEQLAAALTPHRGKSVDGASTLVEFVGDTWMAWIEDDPVDQLLPDEPWADGLTFDLVIEDVNKDRQLGSAIEVYERIIAGTSWKVVLLGLDDQPARSRPTLEHA